MAIQFINLRTGVSKNLRSQTTRLNVARKASLKDQIQLHSPQHSCGAWLASKGVSERIIQKILGHSSTQTTQKYSHVASSAVEGAIEETFGE